MKILDWLDRVLIVTAMVALISMMMLTSVSVIGRYFFNAPIPDDLVFSEMLMVFVVFLPFAAVQAAREHVFVTIFTEWLPNDTKVIMETVGVVVGCFIFTIISCAVFTDFYAAWIVGAYVEGPFELPEYPARFIVFFGLALFSFRLFVDAVVSIVGLTKGSAVASRSEEARAMDSEIT